EEPKEKKKTAHEPAAATAHAPRSHRPREREAGGAGPSAAVAEVAAPEQIVPAMSEEDLERMTAPLPSPVAEPVQAPAELRPRIQISENVSIKDLATKLGVMSKVVLKKLL